MKIKKSTWLLIIICITGLILLLYPTVSNYWNTRHSTRVISDYVEKLSSLDSEQFREEWDRSVEYNASLADRINPFELTDRQKEQYPQLLDTSGSGIMGYIEIESLAVSLPLAHGTSDGVLQRGIGHLEWSSLPVGGENSHCVVSGHRGLPNMKLFTDLDKMKIGDVFTLNVLGNTLTYEVDKITTVKPDELDSLKIERNCDLCTLVTCTPYGINTHRLLVRGHRVEGKNKNVRVISEAVLVDPFVIAPIVAFPLLFALFMIVMLKKPKKKADLSDITKLPKK